MADNKLQLHKSKTESIVIEQNNTFSFKMVVHISALIFPAIIIFYAVPGSSLFSWHPTLMAIGFSLLMVESIIIFSKDSSLFPKMLRRSKASVHFWLAGIGVSAIVSAFVIIYVNKERAGKSHFTSWHGLFGAATVGYMCVQSCAGNVLKYHSYLASYIKIKMVDLRMIHATSGLCAFLLATVTILLALQSSWAQQHLPMIIWGICMACVSASALVVTMHVTSTYLPQITKSTQQRKK